MAEDVYGLTREQMTRLKQMLAAFETGRLNADAVPRKPPLPGPQWTLLGKTGEVIPAAVGAEPGEGVVNRWKYDVEEEEYADEDAIVDEEELVCEAFNPTDAAIAADTWVGLIRDPWSGRYWAMPYSSGGSITVQEEDGTPSITGVDTLRFDEDFGMVVTDLTGGVAGVHVQFATGSLPGVVSAVAQTFGGTKTFAAITVQSGSPVVGGSILVDANTMFAIGDAYTRLAWHVPAFGGDPTGVYLYGGAGSFYGINVGAGDQPGDTGTDPSGNVFTGGICTTVGSSISSVAWSAITSTPITLSGYGITDAQPLDATLTAFAALTIAADSLTIGTGADAFSQTTFAGNTFPAKGSSGSLVAKTISDFGLSLVDDADAAAARITLEIGVSVPTNTYSSGNAGQIAYNGTYLFICVGSSSWGRVVLDFSF